MASIIRDPRGFKRIQWVVGDGVRRTLRLGKVTSAQAEAIKVRIEAVLLAGVTGVIDPEVGSWLTKLDDDFHQKLSRLGLVPPRDHVAPTLGKLTGAFFATLNVKPGTRVAYGQARKSLEDYFGADRLLKSITVLEADKWRRSMVDAKLAGPTVAKRVKVARQIFAKAVKWKMLTESPFSELKAGKMTNPARAYFLSRADAQKVLDACPDAEWRVIFALSRFGGLRCPSEHLGLRWSDIDWQKERVTVRSPKTEGHAGGDQRVIPLFPEVKEHLLALFEQAPAGTEFIITRYRDKSVNLRTQLRRIIDKAGLKKWPRLFHNLRATRQTELAEEYPIQTVCAWIGNSTSVALGHYLQVRDEHFDRAARGPAVGAAPEGGGGAAAIKQRDLGQRAATGANVAQIGKAASVDDTQAAA